MEPHFLVYFEYFQYNLSAKILINIQMKLLMIKFQNSLNSLFEVSLRDNNKINLKHYFQFSPFQVNYKSHECN